MTKGEGARTLVSLQYLRAVAALLVVYLHATLEINNLRAPGASAWIAVGKCGVDIFFVLSGYVMWISTADRPTTVLQFLKRRLIRIVPIYWVVTLAAATVAYFMPQLLHSTKFDLHHVIASLFFIPWRNPVSAGHPITDIAVAMSPIITPGWTLNFEMFFYALFALALLVPQKNRVAALVLIILAAFLTFNALSAYGNAAKFYASNLIFEFLAGTILAGVAGIRKFLSGGKAAWIVLIIAFLLLIADDELFVAAPRALVLGVPAVILVAAAVQLELAGRVKFFRLFDELGNASYSIYVTHIFVVAGLRILPARQGLDVGALGPVFFIAASLVLAAGVGLAVHIWIEKPLIRALNHGLIPVLWRPPTG